MGMISLGCPKNLVDSEMILGDVSQAGGQITQEVESADIVIVNTCSFIDSAKEESVQTILEACEMKKDPQGPKKVVVTGCMAQRYGDDLKREIPEVDAIIGLGQYDNIGNHLFDLMGDEKAYYRVGDPDFACNAEVGRLQLTPQHFAYLRISEGCDNPCTFCAIPKFRGGFRSKPLHDIRQEVTELVDRGVEEIVIISQDTTSYGVDLNGKYQLPQLLETVASVPGVRWVRILYVYPACFDDSMIQAIADIPQVIPYVDIPLQHISENMLRRMGRRLGEKDTRDLLWKMRERIKDLYLRTTFIVGFPGETEEDFQALLNYVQEFKFERLGVFPYSHEEDTPAFKMKETCDEAEMQNRLHELMMAQQPIAFAQNKKRVGEKTLAVIDGHDGENWLARSYGEAPEIDPIIYIPDPRNQARQEPSKSSQETFIDLSSLGNSSSSELEQFQKVKIGSFVPVEITAAKGYDLIARPVVK